MILTNFIWLLIEKHLVGSDCLGAKQLYTLLLDKKQPVCPNRRIRHGLSSSWAKSPWLIPAPKSCPCHLHDLHCSQELDLRRSYKDGLELSKAVTKRPGPQRPLVHSLVTIKEMRCWKGQPLTYFRGWLCDPRGTTCVTLTLEDLRDQEHRLCKQLSKAVYSLLSWTRAVLENVRNNQIPTHSFLRSQEWPKLGSSDSPRIWAVSVMDVVQHQLATAGWTTSRWLMPLPTQQRAC